MKNIMIPVSKTYHVVIGAGLRHHAGTYVMQTGKAEKAVIISDSNVWPIYGKDVTQSLQSAGICCLHYIFPAGESSKTADTYLKILNFLAENHITRTDLLIALGGGVTGDMTGFAAATFLRGIRYIQIPTSLLAMVDSSVGGKTAIDLPAGKNLVGAFYQPDLVLCDIDALSTLPGDIFRDGCAEVIKYGILYDRALFDTLAQNGLDFDREAVIARCVELKRDVVCQDEFDTGARQKLNLGHTIGHSIEHNSDFSISHGAAVAIGTAVISRAAVSAGLCSKEDAGRILSVIEQFGLPVAIDQPSGMLCNGALTDKKRKGKDIHLVVPNKIGACQLYRLPIDQLEAFIQAGL